MPSRNESQGFDERNKILGHAWSSLEPDEKDIFKERYFFTLGYIASGWPQPPVEPGSEPLTPEEIEHFLPIYKQLVNLEKVARDLGKSKFGPHLPTARQNKGIAEVERIDHEVRKYYSHPFWNYTHS